MTDEAKKQFAVAVQNMLEAMDTMTENDVQSVAGQIVGLRNTNKLRVNLDMLTREDVKENRRRLATAIATEKFVEGFVFAMQLASMVL